MPHHHHLRILKYLLKKIANHRLKLLHPEQKTYKRELKAIMLVL